MSAKWIGIAAAGLLAMACGQTSGTPVAVVSPSSPAAGSAASPAAPSSSPSAAASPIASADSAECTIPQPLQDLCVGRAATAAEASAILAVGRPAVEKKYGLKPIASCKKGDTCLIVRNPLLAIVGTEAAVFGAGIGLYPTGSLGCGVLVFMSHDSAGWHYVDSGCVQNPGFMPGTTDQVFVSSSCANVRTAPSVSSTVVACLKGGTQVSVDSAPIYANGHLWWHLAGKGWMVHDFLIAPNL